MERQPKKSFAFFFAMVNDATGRTFGCLRRVLQCLGWVSGIGLYVVHVAQHRLWMRRIIWWLYQTAVCERTSAVEGFIYRRAQV
jgi:hypothetical protein